VVVAVAVGRSTITTTIDTTSTTTPATTTKPICGRLPLAHPTPENHRHYFPTLKIISL
jgi:hypothetical protein